MAIFYDNKTKTTTHYTALTLREAKGRHLAIVPHGLSVDEFRYALATPHRRLANYTDSLHGVFEQEDFLEARMDRLHELKSEASANRHILSQMGYGLLLQTIDRLPSDTEEWLLQRSEVALSDALILSRNQADGIY
jgi:hypothetical protein